MNCIPRWDHLCIVRLCQFSPRNFIPALGLSYCVFVYMFSCTWLKLLRVCLFVYMFINFVFTTLIEKVCVPTLWSFNLVEVTHTSEQANQEVPSNI